MNNDKYLTVTAVNKYLKNILDNNEHLRHIFIRGEISNFKAHTTGHLYFSLKDENSKINAIMFSQQASKLNFKPVDGTKVLVTGRISVYEATGNYQIYVDDMIEDGIGNLYIEFEKLKKKLELEGLFSENHKKPIPKYPKCIGIVTAPTGAAIRDILTTIKKRFPICKTILFPTLVQGENAVASIVESINKAKNYEIDTLIVGRGGGSIEDLWPFNEEIVARAIYESDIPIISAVGHEIDFTISDFVADKRSATPTMGACDAVPNLTDLLDKLKHYEVRLKESINKKVKMKELYLDTLKNSFVIKNPLIMFDSKKQKLDLLNKDLNNIMNQKIEYQKIRFKNNIDKLELLNPLSVLKRGYSITYINDKVVNNNTKLKTDDLIVIKTNNKIIDAKITNIKES